MRRRGLAGRRTVHYLTGFFRVESLWEVLKKSQTSVRRILLIFGTRPEAIKLGPVVRRLKLDQARFETRVCVTAQHRHLLDQVLDVFGIEPDHDLGAMREAQSLTQTTGRILSALESVIADENPDLIMVQGDTTSTVCGPLAGFYNHVPVAHVEAGLRTGTSAEPFPEEMNRRVASEIASYHFAATEAAAENLRRENVSGKIVVSGNPGIDALLETAVDLAAGRLKSSATPTLLPDKKIVLVTAHRRENFGRPIEQICDALSTIALRPDVQIVFPVHPNPRVRAAVFGKLANTPNVTLLDPLNYVDFVDLMRHSHLILTDSGGIQEEAPALGKPVLVLRDSTERPEAIKAGASQIVGSDTHGIVRAVEELLSYEGRYARMAQPRYLFGDGNASERIVATLAEGVYQSAAA
jgi:UDP-N-acetylglucosamine 2-epimerase (non-hydrolysing)